MAINFPSNPSNNDIFTDNNGQQWKYNSSDKSWTALGISVDPGGLQYQGGLNITSTPPAAQSGQFWSVETGGDANAGFAPGVTGTIPEGSFVLYDGVNWELLETSSLWNRTGGLIQPVNQNDVIQTDSGLKVGPSGTPKIQLNADGSIEVGNDYASDSEPNILLNSDVGTSNNPIGSSTFRKDYATFTEGDRDTFNDNTALIIRNNDKSNIVSGSFLRIDTIGTGGYLSQWWVGGKQEVSNSSNDVTNGSSFKISQLTVNRNSIVTDRLEITKDGEVLIPGAVSIGGTLPSAPNISLKADGSTEYTGAITQGGWTDNSDTQTRVNPGSIFVKGPNNINPFLSYLANGYDSADSTLTLHRDGSINAAGNVLIGGTLPSAPNISLNADGSADFTKSVAVSDSVGSIALNTNTAGQGVLSTTTANDLRLQVNNTDQLRLKADGSSTFTGSVSISGNITTVGKVLSERPNATDFAFEVKQGTTRTAYQTCDGSIRVGGSLSNATNPSPNITLNADGNIKAVGLAAAGRVYADNTAAKAGGLVDGDFYRKADGTLMVAFT